MTRRLALLLSLTAALLFGPAAEVSAAGTCALLYVDTDDYDQKEARSINFDECDRNALLTFEVTATAGEKYYIYLGTQCTTTGIDDEDCQTNSDTYEVDANNEIHFTYGVQALLQPDMPGDDNVCDNGQTNEVKALLVPTSATNSSTTTTTTTATTITCTLEVDTEVPAAPTSPKGGSGENTIKVNWKFSDDDDDLKKFLVYYKNCSEDSDSELCQLMPKDCGSSEAWPAGSPPSLTGLSYENASNSHSVNLKGVVETDERAAVMVVAVDAAGNRSEPSAVTCVEGVPTRGFCDEAECKNGCAVSAAGRRGAPSWTSIGVGIIALFYLAMRRRSV